MDEIFESSLPLYVNYSADIRNGANDRMYVYKNLLLRRGKYLPGPTHALHFDDIWKGRVFAVKLFHWFFYPCEASEVAELHSTETRRLTSRSETQASLFQQVTAFDSTSTSPHMVWLGFILGLTLTWWAPNFLRLPTSASYSYVSE